MALSSSASSSRARATRGRGEWKVLGDWLVTRAGRAALPANMPAEEPARGTGTRRFDCGDEHGHRQLGLRGGVGQERQQVLGIVERVRPPAPDQIDQGTTRAARSCHPLAPSGGHHANATGGEPLRGAGGAPRALKPSLVTGGSPGCPAPARCPPALPNATAARSRPGPPRVGSVTGTEPISGKVAVIDPGHDGGNAGHARDIATQVDIGNGSKECDTVGAGPDIRRLPSASPPSARRRWPARFLRRRRTPR